MLRIKDKIIWITGASSGIGEALAYAFNEMGSKVILSARNESRLEEVAKNCANPVLVSCLKLDLAEADQMEEKVQQALQKFGGVDILINNAGISQRSLILDTKLSVYKELMDINYLGTVALSKA
ncbi:MAG: SDR family NAD(P)-dependent oxidoreductase, partial [Eudoraea sp.]|nr:SDR family NAD(P)-dependent oxidoreductase [Eudoraea sp.]